ncbi:MAG: inositol monophosphatase, partial [Planctomycetales bacterium]|nr:inositol monophosphatase [Planctomycetales bacterium]
MSNHTTTCEQAAREAGAVLMQWRRKVTAREKGPSDLVTEADHAAQHVAQRVLLAAHPDFGFLGEEGEAAQNAANFTDPQQPEYCWIVDPLDGTMNFVHDLPGWCVSIGLARRGQVVAGCVFDPVADRCFTAESGGGAFCNGAPLATSGAVALRDALVAISLPAS